MMDDLEAPERPKPSRLTLWLLIGPLVVLVIASYVGDALAPTLFDKHPLWLIALNARNRNLALTTNYLDAFSYYSVGFVRLLLADPIFYLLGYFYGDAAVRWAERRSRTFGGMLRSVEQFFQKASYPLVLIAPNNPICLFAGASGMSPPVFLALNITGTIGRLILIRWLGDIFSDPIEIITDFIRSYRLPLTAVTIAITGFLLWSESRGEGETELEALVRLQDELEEAEEDIEAEHAEELEVEAWEAAEHAAHPDDGPPPEEREP
jgi:membrane protein DedA with SNARE-associated domain